MLKMTNTFVQTWISRHNIVTWIEHRSTTDRQTRTTSAYCSMQRDQRELLLFLISWGNTESLAHFHWLSTGTQASSYLEITATSLELICVLLLLHSTPLQILSFKFHLNVVSILRISTVHLNCGDIFNLSKTSQTHFPLVIKNILFHRAKDNMHGR